MNCEIYQDIKIGIECTKCQYKTCKKCLCKYLFTDSIIKDIFKLWSRIQG